MVETCGSGREALICKLALITLLGGSIEGGVNEVGGVEGENGYVVEVGESVDERSGEDR